MNPGSSKVLVVGGAGLIGAASALHLADLGYEVTIAGRTPPNSPPLARLPFAGGSFLTDDFSDSFLASFDALVFAAANDVRQLPKGADEAEYFHQANSIGVPAFFARAREAGINRAVYVGSLYTDVLSAEQIAASGYVRSRKAADEGVRALAASGFSVCSLNAPFIMGHVEGVAAISLEYSIRYLLGQFGPEPLWMISGGSNFMSASSYAQAVAGALERGVSGKGYLVGDENWTFAYYYELLLDALGMKQRLPVRNEEHPSMPDFSLYSGRGATVAYEPDPDSVALLGYARHDAERAVREMAPYYRKIVSAR